MKTSHFLAAAFLAVTLGATSVIAQDAPPPEPAPQAPAPAPGEPGRGPGGPGGFGEAFRQRMNERVKTALKASDEEWSVIQPLIEKVQQKQREVITGRMGGFGERRGIRGDRGGHDGNRQPRPTAPEVEALKAALENENSSTTDIKAKLEAVRAARKKAMAELDASSEELRKVLTLRQEATLSMMGILQ